MIMIYTRYFLILALLLNMTNAVCQVNAGSSPQSQQGYITVLKGNMPLVISIPHGGYLLPDDIPERPCTNCAKNQDIFTIEIGNRIRETIFGKSGCYPYIIINNLHRTRLDPNRNIAEAAAGNRNAEKAWNDFQNYIEDSKRDVLEKFGKGLYIDLHGHRHEISRIELGYMLSNEELQFDDGANDLEAFTEFSSIRNLIRNNPDSLSYSELVRGKTSLGTMLSESGYECVPSSKNPYPGSAEPYFSGGYNISRHGSSSGGTIDGIQIEIDEEIRTDLKRRDQLSDEIAEALLVFLKTHYFPDIRSFLDFNSGRK
jgi:hypothetical protein